MREFRGSLPLLKVHARAWRIWRGLTSTPGAGRPQTPASRNGVWFDRSLTAGLCAADRAAVEGFPWPGRPRGWTQLGSRSPALRLAAAVLPAGRRRKVRGARSCVKARAARSPAPLGPRLDTRSLRVGFAASAGRTKPAAPSPDSYPKG